jgi:hypothetical protein
VPRIFCLENRGSTPIELLEARTSCGCAVPRWEHRVLAPGSTTELTVAIQTLTQPAGRQAWKTHLRYRLAGMVREMTLEVRAELVAELRLEPATLVLHAVDELRHPLRLIDYRARPLRILRAAASTTYVGVELDSPTSGASGPQMQLLRAVVAADHPEGRHEHTLSLFTDDADYPELRVPITVVKRGSQGVQVLPSSISFDRTSASRLVRLRSAGESAIVIDRVEASHPSLIASWAAGPGNDATLRVRRPPTANEPLPADASLRVHLRSPSKTILTIPVHAE